MGPDHGRKHAHQGNPRRPRHYYIVPFEFLDREYRFFEFDFQPEGTEIVFQHKIKVQLWRQD